MAMAIRLSIGIFVIIPFSYLYNVCFLMPTEKNEIIKKGTARMPMLEALGLENIQIRLIPANMLYERYLAKRKIDIGLLEL